MKRYYVPIIVVLVSLSLVSCERRQAIADRYESEKLLFNADRDMQRLQASGQFDQESARKTLIDQYSRAYSNSLAALQSLGDSTQPELRELASVAFQAANRIAQIYVAGRDQSAAAAMLDSLVREVPLSAAQKANTLLNLGQTLNAAGQIERALKIYRDLINAEMSPFDERGNLIYPLFNLPLHVYDISKAVGSNLIDNDFAIAERYYNGLLDHPDVNDLHNSCQTNLATLYSSAEFWNQTVEHLRLIKDSTGAPHMAARIRAIDIEIKNLGQPATAERRLDSLMANYDKNDTLYYPPMIMRKAAIEMARGNQAEARQFLNQLKRDYDRFYNRTPSVQLMMAQSFEREKNDSRAKLEYDLLLEKYKYSDEAMGSYLHLATKYRNQGDLDLSQRLIEAADEDARHMINRSRGTLAEARASLFLADLKSLTGQWDSAGVILIDVAQNFPGTVVARQALVNAADIYLNKLSDKKTADSLKRAVSENFPQMVEPVDLSDQLQK